MDFGGGVFMMLIDALGSAQRERESEIYLTTARSGCGHWRPPRRLGGMTLHLEIV